MGHIVSATTVHRILHGKDGIKKTYAKQVQVILLPNVALQLLLTSGKIRNITYNFVNPPIKGEMGVSRHCQQNCQAKTQEKVPCS
jgi:hypothetical protein